MAYKHYASMSKMNQSKQATPPKLSRHSKPDSTVRAYFQLTRLHKFPAGNVLVFVPFLWGLTMAAYRVSLPVKDITILTVMYIIAGTVTHSTACIINDICDRDLDAQVARTKTRPLVTGHVSVTGARVFLLCWTAALLALLSLTSGLAFKLGLFGIFPLHAIYPLTKRWTYWPQVWLGITMNWGILVSWASLMDSIDWRVVVPLLLGSVCWSIVYDTIYACQDRKDDIKCGVKSTALLFGNFVKPILSIFATFSIIGFVIAGVENGQGIGFFCISVPGAAVHLLWQLYTLDTESDNDCWGKFTANGNFAYIVWAGMLVDYYRKVIN